MIKAFKKHLIVIILFSILSIFILVITTVKTKYVAYMPGEVERVSNVVEIDGVDSSSNYYSTSVYYFNNVTIFQKFLYSKLNTVTLYKKGKTPTEIENLQGEIEHNSALYTSIISAYDLANVYLDYEYVGTYVYSTNSTVLNVGDVVLGSSLEECKENLKNENIEILRNNTKTTVTLNENDKVYLEYGYYEIHNDDIKVYSSSNQGPSAGFMQSLKLYDDLVEENFGTKYKIAGTGTIDEFGNVGAIGCVDLKIYTAMYNKCDIFFIPVENMEEAKEALNGIKTDMRIIYVNTLSEAVEALKGLE